MLIMQWGIHLPDCWWDVLWKYSLECPDL